MHRKWVVFIIILNGLLLIFLPFKDVQAFFTVGQGGTPGLTHGDATPVPQPKQDVIPGGKTVVLVLDNNVSSLHLAPPSAMREGAHANATVEISYINAGQISRLGDTCLAFPETAKAAFTAATDIWATQITSSVPISIEACWSNLPTGILGWAGTINYFRNFPNAPQSNTWYQVALANALTGMDLDPGFPDVSISYNNLYTSEFYLGTDGNPPLMKLDFESIVLHEITHGLGLAGSMGIFGGVGSWGFGTGNPFAYDLFTQDNSNNSLINPSIYPNPSAGLGTALTSNGVYFNGTHANAANNGQRVKLYAPSSWIPGSSYSHLDEIYNGTINALMTFSISRGESLHNPGPITMGILRDIGWQMPTPPGTYTISGRVTDALGNGIGGVFFSYGSGTVASTDVSGYYSITGLSSATYHVTPAKTDYTFNPTARDVIISGGNETAVDFSSIYIPPTTYSISGRVTDSQGSGIAQVSISIGSGPVASTDSSGNYAITGLPAGMYILTPAKTGTTFSPASRSATITSTNVVGMDFTGTTLPTPVYGISGRVTDNTGIGVAGVSVSDGNSRSILTDSMGNYSLGGFSSGSYILIPIKSGFTFSPTSLSVNVSDADLIAKDFLATALPVGPYAISGKIVDGNNTAIPGVLVSDVLGYSATTDNSGIYTLSNLPAGSYVLTPYKVGYTFTPGFTNPVVITNASANSKDFSAMAAPVGNYRITGRVTDAGGNPLAGVPVSDVDGIYRAVSDNNGDFVLSNLPAGYYVFAAQRSDEIFLPAWRTVKLPENAVNQNFSRAEKTITVNSTNDLGDSVLGDGICATASGECTLRAAIEESNARSGGDIILVPAGTYGLATPATSADVSSQAGEPDLNGNLRITDSVVLQGAGADKTIIDAHGYRSVIEIAQSGADISVELSGITLQKGGGAGIVAQTGHGFLALDQCVVHQNAGPGLFVNGLQVSLNESTIADNSVYSMTGGVEVENALITIMDSTIDNNRGKGGGLRSGSGLLMRNSTISNNRGDTQFGGVSVEGGGAIVNSTISGNAGREGAGIWTKSNLDTYNATIVHNKAEGSGGGEYNSGLGGGIYIYPGSTEIAIQNSILSENSSPTGSPDCFGKVTSKGYNLVGDRTGCNFCAVEGDLFGLDPGIDGLVDNGGVTFTHALLSGSWAIDMGNPSGCRDQNGVIQTVDQRGMTRPTDGKKSGKKICDIGSFEFQPVDAPYQISGILTDERYQPVSNATVTMDNGRIAITDAKGKYIFSELKTGIYKLTADKAGYKFSPPSREVKLPPNTTKINFVGIYYDSGDYTISGKVVDSFGNPLAGVSVATEGGLTGFTDSAGNYTIRAVGAGSHVITPYLAEYQFVPAELAVLVSDNVVGKNFVGVKQPANPPIYQK